MGRDLVLITSTVQVELSELSLNFDDIRTLSSSFKELSTNNCRHS